MPFVIKRIYEAGSPRDGIRVLVDRLWPRGVSKMRARVDHWMKDIAPSPGLRMWFDHRPDRFEVFEQRYASELADNPLLPELRALGRGQVVTLLYAARDPKINHARVLQSVLKGKSAPSKPTKKASASALTQVARRKATVSKTSRSAYR